MVVSTPFALSPRALCSAALHISLAPLPSLKTLKAVACACASGCILDGGHVRCVVLACLPALPCLPARLFACLLAGVRAVVDPAYLGVGT